MGGEISKNDFLEFAFRDIDEGIPLPSHEFSIVGGSDSADFEVIDRRELRVKFKNYVAGKIDVVACISFAQSFVTFEDYDFAHSAILHGLSLLPDKPLSVRTSDGRLATLAWFIYGIILMKMGKQEEGRRYVSKCLELDDSLPVPLDWNEE
jgi:hypothetical protein